MIYSVQLPCSLDRALLFAVEYGVNLISQCKSAQALALEFVAPKLLRYL
jgi:hypothetical protein